MTIKEYGSDFHFEYKLMQSESSDSILKLFPDSAIYFSGRSALYSLIEFGIRKYNWKVVFLPEYYCHEVAQFISRLPVQVKYIEYGPYHEDLDFSKIEEYDKKENVIVEANFFGIGNKKLKLNNAFLIEDHTHDLASDWAINSEADYCFASLRKALPIPTGGIVWSPKQHTLPQPAEVTEKVSSASSLKLSAMLLKRLYLEGHQINKQEFRDLFINSEYVYEDPLTNSRLPSLFSSFINNVSIVDERIKKKSNLMALYDLIADKRIIYNANINDGQCPLGLLLYFNDENGRDKMRQHLINNNVYPTVLWPKQKSIRAKEFSDKILFIHCDSRYNFEDMRYIAERLNEQTCIID